MTKGFQILMLLALMVLGMAGAARAQDFSDSGSPSQSSDPAPKNPARLVYDNGTIAVLVHNDRNYGYRIGSPIPVEIDFITKPGVVINVDNLRAGQFDPENGSDVELVSGPVVSEPFEQDGMIITRVTLQVNTWTMKETPVFKSVFLWAKERLGTGSPNWQKAATPDFAVTRSFTATAASQDMDEGDLSQQTSPHPAPVQPMMATALLLGMIPGAWLLWGLYLWAFPPRKVPAHERAWAVFDEVLAASDPKKGLSYDQTTVVAAALREYLNVAPVAAPDQIKTTLEAFYAGKPNQFELAAHGEEAFVLLQKALYQKPADGATIALSPEETRELLRRIERLVPRG